MKTHFYFIDLAFFTISTLKNIDFIFDSDKINSNSWVVYMVIKSSWNSFVSNNKNMLNQDLEQGIF